MWALIPGKELRGSALRGAGAAGASPMLPEKARGDWTLGSHRLVDFPKRERRKRPAAAAFNLTLCLSKGLRS